MTNSGETGTLDAESLVQLALALPENWRPLAQGWVSAGYQSEKLRAFVELSDEHVRSNPGQMVEVLRSLGVVIGDSKSLAAELFTATGFETRCRSALHRVQTDLRRTGYDDIGLTVVNVNRQGTPVTAQAALLDGSTVASSEQLMAWMDDALLIGRAAASVSELLLIALGKRWPRCAEHVGRYLVPRGARWTFTDLEPDEGMSPTWWWCNSRPPHRVALVGELAS